MTATDELKKAIALVEQAANILQKSQMSFDFTVTNPHAHDHHVAYTRTNASGTVSNIAAKGAQNTKLPTHWREAYDHAEEKSHEAWNGEGDKHEMHLQAAKALRHSAAMQRKAAVAADDAGEDEAAGHHTDKAARHTDMAVQHLRAAQQHKPASETATKGLQNTHEQNVKELHDAFERHDKKGRGGLGISVDHPDYSTPERYKTTLEAIKKHGRLDTMSESAKKAIGGIIDKHLGISQPATKESKHDEKAALKDAMTLSQKAFASDKYADHQKALEAHKAAHNKATDPEVKAKHEDYIRMHGIESSVAPDKPKAGIHSDNAFDQIKAAGGSNVLTTSGHIEYYFRGDKRQLAHTDAPDGHRYVDPAELKQHLDAMATNNKSNKPAADSHTAANNLQRVADKHSSNMYGKADSFKLTHGNYQVPASSVAGNEAREYKTDEVYSNNSGRHNGQLTPVGSDFRPEFKKIQEEHGHNSFILNHDGHRYLVDPQGYNYARYISHIKEEPKVDVASVPPAPAKPAIPESLVEVRTEQHQFAHGKKPSGRGTWFFSQHKSIDFGKHKEGEDFIQHNGTYSEAKAAAKKWAAAKGHHTIHAQP